MRNELLGDLLDIQTITNQLGCIYARFLLGVNIVNDRSELVVLWSAAYLMINFRMFWNLANKLFFFHKTFINVKLYKKFTLLS